MEIPSYVFQSPYPSVIQVGRPDPQAEAQQEQNSAVDAIAKAGNESVKKAENYQVKSTSSVNVAVSSVDGGVSGSLETFSTLNAQVQGLEAYSG